MDHANTLYLVSAMKRGISYWKAGITKHSNPLDRDRKHYLEVFRAEASQDAELVELAIARTFRWVMEGSRRDGFIILEPPAREGLSYDFPLEAAMEIYDWWLDLAKTSDRAPNPCYEPEWGGLPTLLDQRYSNGFYTAFYFCYHTINNSPGIFDFSVPAADYENATHEELKAGFANWLGLSGGFIESTEDLRSAAQHWFEMARIYIPKINNLCSLRPSKPQASKNKSTPMWS